MTRLPIVAVVLLTGCSQLTGSLGVAGREPGQIECKGAIELSGSGSLGMLGMTAGSNEFRLSMSCGDGAFLRQGMPAPWPITSPSP